MKNPYDPVDLESVRFLAEDVITTSGGDPGCGPDEHECAECPDDPGPAPEK